MKRLDEDGCRKIKKASLGGRCWFRVDSKSFEISLESVNGKVVGKIVESGMGGCPLGSDLRKRFLLSFWRGERMFCREGKGAF